MPEDARFNIAYGAGDAELPVTWHGEVSIPLTLALSRLDANSNLEIRKSPPDLLIGPYWRALSSDAEGEVELRPVFATDRGLPRETRELVRDENEAMQPLACGS